MLARFAFFCCLAAAGIARAQQATEWTPQFLEPSGGTRSPADALRIRLAGIPQESLERLGLELDEIDVTALVTMEGDTAVLTPVQPLAYGGHHLRLTEQTKDGGIVERGLWPFEVRKAAAASAATLKGNVAARAGYRALDGNLDNAPRRAQMDAAGQLNGAYAGERWRANAMLNFIANSQSQLMPRQSGHVDLGQFLIAADSGMYGFKAGDHAIGPDSLVLQSFARRGVSASATAPDNQASITGFAMHASQLAGAAHGFGVTDNSDRVDGVVAALRPISGQPDALELSGTYVSGETQAPLGVAAVGGAGTPLGGVAGGPGPSGGKASSVAADGNLLQRRLRLRGEYATSLYDFDGSDPTLGPERGHAYAGLVNYTPWHDMKLAEQPLAWNLGAERTRLSTFFRSPSNPVAISDRDTTRLFTGVNWNGLDLQASASRDFDNVDDNPLVPRTAGRQRNAALTFTPIYAPAPQADGQPAALPWYGRPSLNASFMSLNREFEQLNGVSYNVPVHSTYNNVFGASFQYTSGSLSLTHSRVRDRGFGNTLDLTPPTRTVQTRLQGNLRLFDKLDVGAQLFTDEQENSDTQIRTRGLGGGFNLGYPFTERLSGALAYAQRHGWTSDGTDDGLTSDTTASLNWALEPARDAKPGVTLGVDGSYHDARNRGSASLTPGVSMYQLFVRLNMSWAPSY